jgi:hypothetical protein
MPLNKSQLDRMIARMDEALSKLAESNTLPVPYQASENCAPPRAPFSDSPLEGMAKEPLWGGRPPLPIEHL